MILHEFREYELSEKAFDIYSNSDFVFYYDERNCTFNVADNNNSTFYMVGNGTLCDVEEFLSQFA